MGLGVLGREVKRTFSLEGPKLFKGPWFQKPRGCVHKGHDLFQKPRGSVLFGGFWRKSVSRTEEVLDVRTEEEFYQV